MTSKKAGEMNKADAKVERFLDRIFIARGHPVIRDSDLAELYETTTKALNQQVQRNMDRFDDLFAFRLTDDEWSALRSHDVTSKKGRGGRRYAPIIFTQEGMLMAATVVRSPRATETVKMMVRVFRDVFPQYFSGSARIETKSASSGKRSLLLDSIVDAIRDIGKIGIDPDTDATVASELGKLPSAIPSTCNRDWKGRASKTRRRGHASASSTRNRHGPGPRRTRQARRP